MATEIQGSPVNIKASRRPIWEDPNLHYDGAEPPKEWLNKLKQLKQIHGYNEKETLLVAEHCLKGSARLWFRIHQPKSFEALRMGLHTRFASGPLLAPATVSPPKASARSFDSSSPAVTKIGGNVLTALQSNVGDSRDPPNRVKLHGDSHLSSFACNPASISTDKSRKSQGDSNTSLTRKKQQRIRSSRSNDLGSNEKFNTPRISLKNASVTVGVKAENKSKKSSQHSVIFSAKQSNGGSGKGSVKNSGEVPVSGEVPQCDNVLKRGDENPTMMVKSSNGAHHSGDPGVNECGGDALDCTACPAVQCNSSQQTIGKNPGVTFSCGTRKTTGDRTPRKKGNKSSGTTKSISISTMSCHVSARDVLEENGVKRLPASCKNLPVNWQEALLKFKYAIHQAMRGDWTQMSTDFCKYYLRCYHMRTSGSKRELIHRIRDHLELTDGSGSQKYPRDSFVMKCAGMMFYAEASMITARGQLLVGL